MLMRLKSLNPSQDQQRQGQHQNPSQRQDQYQQRQRQDQYQQRQWQDQQRQWEDWYPRQQQSRQSNYKPQPYGGADSGSYRGRNTWQPQRWW
ncbi:hypothetical protein CDD83_3644 [Cordyceps sp. RAO-2017]|nr:hypothetical protein CDD83_3644 [Cordyceps sp. RAO-2017]